MKIPPFKQMYYLHAVFYTAIAWILITTSLLLLISNPGALNEPVWRLFLYSQWMGGFIVAPLMAFPAGLLIKSYCEAKQK